MLVAKRKAASGALTLSAIGMPLSERTASGNSQMLGAVCGTCNNGWMSRLESAFGDLLPRLRADMSPGHFSKEERRIIALWIVKTGIIVHYSSNYRTILPARGSARAVARLNRAGRCQGIWRQCRIPKRLSDGSKRISALAVVQRSDVSRVRNWEKHICVRAFDLGHFHRFWLARLEPGRV